MAGTWNEIIIDGVNPTKGENRSITKISAEFTADAENASVDDLLIREWFQPGLLAGIGIVFDAVATPDSVSIDVKDEDGLSVATGTLAASARVSLAKPVPMLNRCSVSISGNTVNSAKAKVCLYFFNNRR